MVAVAHDFALTRACRIIPRVNAVERARQVASWAVVTNPKDARAWRLYEAFGFRPLTAERWFVLMKEAAEQLSAR